MNTTETEFCDKETEINVDKSPPTRKSLILDTMERPAETTVVELVNVSFTALSTFEDELPDPDQALYIQMGKPLDVFERFSNLPIEIRLRIWRLSFPEGRNMWLDIGHNTERFFEDWYKHHLQRPFPIALYINQESRSETLRHYVILYQSEGSPLLEQTYGSRPYKKGGKRPMCISFTRDTVWIDPDPSWTRKLPWCNAWIEYVNESIPGGTNTIQSLEILDVDLKRGLQHMEDIWGYRPGHNRGGLEWFHNLKTLRVKLSQEGLEKTELKGAGDRIRDWYLGYQQRAPECRIPQITVENYGPPQWRALK
ncbi:hypothetical protein BDZ45DRAFT_738682 [Acephala macrosclerotiorum]|nr:hypothetical protein BDZ45DRAFT_738682 [Acephala macrosclerotiorum]